MEKKRIYLSPPHLEGQEISYIQQAIDQNWVAPVGENLDRFEAHLCDYTGAKRVLALQSGTAAIHLALRLLGVGKGDTVICPTFTFVATLNPILYQGAQPILVDSETQTWNLCPRALEEAILTCKKENQKPKAILVVHLYGQAAQMDEILQISQQYEIPIIEDAAEALGSTYRQQALGTFGKLGVFSFNGNKIITTSGGGALVSQNPSLIERALYLSTQAREQAAHYQHTEIGYNYRMSNILAGIGVGQMEVLAKRVRQRRANFDYYQQVLGDLPGIAFQPELEHTLSNRWLTCILANSFEQRENIRLALAQANIEARPLWKPMHLQPLCQQMPYYGERVAEALFQRGLCLPSGSSLTSADLERICHIVREVWLPAER